MRYGNFGVSEPTFLLRSSIGLRFSLMDRFSKKYRAECSLSRATKINNFPKFVVVIVVSSLVK